MAWATAASETACPTGSAAAVAYTAAGHHCGTSWDFLSRGAAAAAALGVEQENKAGRALR
jgi:hypothetical protein